MQDFEPGFLGGPLQSDETLPLRAYRRIRKAMFDGDLPPGLPISEPQLSRELGISRAALREGLVRLETEGYVSRNPAGRWRVTDLSQHDAEEMYQCRGALEGLAASLAAERATGDHLAEMAEALRQARERYTSGDVAGAAAATTRFHDSVVAAASNRKLLTLMNMLRPQLLQYRTMMMQHKTRQESFLDQNEALLDSIRQGRPEDADKRARDSAADDLRAVMSLFDSGHLGAKSSSRLLDPG